MVENKTIELWDGYEVRFDEKLFNDFDFAADLNDAAQKNDITTIVTMYMALVGGEEVYQDVRERIVAEYGYFDANALKKITDKIEANFPKSGNRAQRRSWKTSR